MILTGMILFAAFHFTVQAANAADALKQLNAAAIESHGEMREAVSLIDRTLKQGSGDFGLQKLVLTKSGECITALVALRAKSPKAAGNGEEKEIFLKLREILKQILTVNEKIIGDFQEKTLDTLKDPGEFFNSARWQEPQYLISLSSYWMGWNGYYASSLVAEKDPMFATLLNESIKGFSRSFVDFQEEAVIVRSLLGRALCYEKLNALDKALRDLKTVKRRIGRDDPLYFRCVYEEIRMIYDAGNPEGALKAIKALKAEYPRDKIPEEFRKNLEAMNSRALTALMEKQGKARPGDSPESSEKKPGKMFEELKQLADTPAGMSEMYRYVRENTGSLANLPYARLGPAAALALGDLMYEKKQYDRALVYYLPLISDSPAFMSDRMDGVWFRTAYGYCIGKQYANSFDYLKGFHKKFPGSELLSQASSLYYAAAARNYRKDKSPKAYDVLMDAVRTYTRRCTGDCPEMSEARFRMGRHYQKTGKTKEAVAEFIKVGKDSPNYGISRIYLLQYYVDELQTIEKNGGHNSEEAEKLYQKGISAISAYRKWERAGGNSARQKEIEPHMILLESQISLFGPESRLEKNLDNLNGFEKRFPGKKKLFSEIFKLRMIMFQRLGMISEGEEELRRFGKQETPDDDVIAVLTILAGKFDHLGFALKEQKLETESGRCLDFALMINEFLAEKTCNNPENRKHCDAARLSVARIHSDRGRLDKAEAVYRDILKRNPFSADAVYNLGLIYEKTQQWKNALDMWRKFSDGVTSGSYHWYESRYKIAHALSRMGDTKKACEILNMTLVLHPDLGSEGLKAEYTELQAKICKEGPSP